MVRWFGERVGVMSSAVDLDGLGVILPRRRARTWWKRVLPETESPRAP